MKIRPVGGMLFYTDVQTDRLDQADSRISQFRVFGGVQSGIIENFSLLIS
jgi:hypothetical protein